MGSFFQFLKTNFLIESQLNKLKHAVYCGTGGKNQDGGKKTDGGNAVDDRSSFFGDIVIGISPETVATPKTPQSSRDTPKNAVNIPITLTPDTEDSASKTSPSKKPRYLIVFVRC